MNAESILYDPYRSRPISDFCEELRFEFPKLPEPMLHFYVAKAAREAAVRGNLVRRRAFVQSLPGEEEYLLESPDGLEVTGILRIAEFPRCSCPRDVRRTFTFPEGCRFCGRRTAWYEPHEKALHIDRTCCGSEFLVELAVAPARDACELPAVLYDDWLELVVLGARAGVLLVPGRDWTSMPVGRAYMQEFLNRIRDAAVDTAAHRMKGGARMDFGRVM